MLFIFVRGRRRTRTATRPLGSPTSRRAACQDDELSRNRYQLRHERLSGGANFRCHYDTDRDILDWRRAITATPSPDRARICISAHTRTLHG